MVSIPKSRPPVLLGCKFSFDALRKGDVTGNGVIELSELVGHVQGVVPKVAADWDGNGRAATSEPVYGRQAARFGSRGEDLLAQGLQ